MCGSVIGKNNLLYVLVAALLISLVISTLHSVMAIAQSGTAINAIICANGATISLDEPMSDSVVTKSMVELKGSVNQASQIVVEIDGQYNSTEALTVGQATYTTTVQLTPGTHTIKLTAIDSCSVANSSVNSVVTYTPPPSQGSNGATTITGISKGENPEGIIILPSDDDMATEPVGSQGLAALPFIDVPNRVLEWLNVSPVDSSVPESGQKLSLARAITIAAGLYMATIGVSTIIVERFANSSLFTRFKREQRHMVASRLLRLLGGLMVIGGLFF